MSEKRGFGSDNHSGVHPKILEAIVRCNIGHAPSYGTDEISLKAQERFKELFGPCHTYFVFNGTGANVLALQAMGQSYHSVLCTDESHLYNDECGAPEIIARRKLIPVKSLQAKMTLESARSALIRMGDQHHTQAKILSLTQPTELGTCYSLTELKELIQWAKAQRLFIHIDGARLAVAARALGCDFKNLTSDLGVDIVSFGGTKNGLMMGEAVLVLNPALNEGMQFLRKQSLQLPSKSRFIASQFLAYLENDLWKEIADHSISMAQYLYKQTKDIAGVEIDFQPQANSVFARIPQKWIRPLREKHFFYVWNSDSFLCRWMTSFDTKREDIDQFADELLQLSKSML